jgi:deoxyribonuclease (pyrimidine dimer)
MLYNTLQQAINIRNNQMTRINVVPVEDLSRQHLLGENKEILRVFGLVRKAKSRGINKYNFNQKVKQPSDYTLGEGHVKFFYDKLGFIVERYKQVTSEMIKRGYTPNIIPESELVDGIESFWLKGYTPTENAIKINIERINERLGV